MVLRVYSKRNVPPLLTHRLNAYHYLPGFIYLYATLGGTAKVIETISAHHGTSARRYVCDKPVHGDDARPNGHFEFTSIFGFALLKTYLMR